MTLKISRLLLVLLSPPLLQADTTLTRVDGKQFKRYDTGGGATKVRSSQIQTGWAIRVDRPITGGISAPTTACVPTLPRAVDKLTETPLLVEDVRKDPNVLAPYSIPESTVVLSIQGQPPAPSPGSQATRIGLLQVMGYMTPVTDGKLICIPERPP
jgi:hypothetical protein